MHENPKKIDKSEDMNEKPVRGRWVGIIGMLLVSLVLWGAIILMGQEMLRRFDTEIAQGIEAFH
ncbi:MAG: hypothetical protein ACE5GK_10090 [Nitrospiria bacterium]